MNNSVALMQAFVNALRECLGKDPLYEPGDSHRTEAERFYVPAYSWSNATPGPAVPGQAASDSLSWLHLPAAGRAGRSDSGTSRG